MKIINNIKSIFTVLLTCVLFVSCNVEEEDVSLKPFVPSTVENPVTITQFIIKDPNFSILEKLMRRAETLPNVAANRKILSVLNLPGQNTIFAPNDAAFKVWMDANGYKESDLDKLNGNVVANLVWYAVMTGKFLQSDLSTGYVASNALRGIGTAAVKVSLHIDTANGVMLNLKSKVISTNESPNNGVIHTVDAVVDVPTVNDWIKLIPEFSSFAAAVSYADGVSTTPALTNALSSTSQSVTAFVGNNAAFSSLYTELGITDITGLTTAQVTNICRTTIVSTASTTPAISSSLFVSRSNAKLQTILAGAAGQVNFDGKTTPAKPIIIDPRKRTSNIVPVLDIQGSNGVIHTLDKVVLPLTL